MDRQTITAKLIESGLVAVIRLDSGEKLPGIISALRQGGINALEITMTTPGALEIIKNFAAQTGKDFLIGAGSVLDAETARLAILNGAQFIVGPIFNPEVVRMCHRYDKPAIPGAFTPTEILTAWEQGADLVKVFPTTALGPSYIKDILGPLPQVKLLPTGGVTLENAAEFIRSGACCLGVGTALLNKKMIAADDWQALAKHAEAFRSAVLTGRSSK
ncbi:MAG TPA: bifunctional 4-hydroxy-2-oxoglutarate aldolase/2-dehydro-3-deoxy-phosphogluconate aldolase [Candidatus Marinimicrobia bacterium]|jgi:2-dehydro-3-deoxyphosphogluconate aldolase/(4S)-4-hydroxy-2-oxoglutarate aldolase|nr:bifunctional 4-hydroxy-2-oxoglutarate aldolase/2-dehydro-3-deoxy-phosphogluconate aldolase [Candidatus Neomarinimicrobiota bacterium]HOV22832.1 bifunctional 4-hydroxy-2-oxoglutarate aldolase/2-dehydro-3-deoxy-phosphogluconate aldolase [Candidatus Neomarinimicrobiota bacterium]HPA99279.1 bifunctional 4-hydroxy-2-oxoglutarate aldolase/2-dehydro-3-deoxy-phosphogluconate aldolase [Candidatus Neomarinimicrobiota bacterium]HPN73693.1 bifunctional 4-hydroxy-2-oxoglutarate aldolase/2-dehydro-3-deoxy-